MITNLPYRGGDAGVEDTIKIMREYSRELSTDARVKNLVKAFTGEDYQQIKKAFNYIVSKIRYQEDGADEVVKSVKWTLFGPQPYGDCDDLSVALATLLLAMGFRVAFVTIAWKPGSDDYSHVYCIVYVPSIGGWMPVDPTRGLTGYGWEMEKVKRRTFWKI